MVQFEKKLKVLWFTNLPIIEDKEKKITHGGWMSALCNQIAKQGDIELCVSCQLDIREIKTEKVNGINLCYFPRNYGGFKILFKKRILYKIDNKKALAHYLDIIDRFKPDIIQIFGTENNFGILIPHVNIPVITHLQGVLTVYEKKYFSGLTRKEIWGKTDVREFIRNSDLISKYRFFKKRVETEKACYGLQKYLIGRTEWDYRVMKILAPNAAYFHCDELLREEFYKKQWALPKNNIIKLVSIINDSPFKGLETIIECAILLKSVNLKFDWTIIGINSRNQYGKILKKKYHFDYEKLNICLEGKCPADQIVSHLCNSNIFIHASHIENSPNSVCEAMLVGMPVIATFTGGTSSILKDREEGILIQDGDPFMMAGSIIELSGNIELQLKLSANARKKALDRHDPNRVIHDLLEIYKNIIKQ